MDKEKSHDWNFISEKNKPYWDELFKAEAALGDKLTLEGLNKELREKSLLFPFHSLQLQVEEENIVEWQKVGLCTNAYNDLLSAYIGMASLMRYEEKTINDITIKTNRLAELGCLEVFLISTGTTAFWDNICQSIVFNTAKKNMEIAQMIQQDWQDWLRKPTREIENNIGALSSPMFKFSLDDSISKNLGLLKTDEVLEKKLDKAFEEEHIKARRFPIDEQIQKILEPSWDTISEQVEKILQKAVEDAKKKL